MVAQHYRWDFIGLSTDTKPTPETSEKVVDGSTYYCSDNSKLYVFYKDTWYEKTVSGGGGTSDFDDLTNRPKYNGTAMTSETNIPLAPTVVQTDGISETDVMSQKATTGMIRDLSFPNNYHIKIGDSTTVDETNQTSKTVIIGAGAQALKGSGTANYCTAIGGNAYTSSFHTIAIGGNTMSDGSGSVAIGSGDLTGSSKGAKARSVGSIAIGQSAAVAASNNGAIALGSYSTASHQGELNIGTSSTSMGYNSSNYRLISGVYDGQDLHDAATVAQGNTLATTAPTTSTVGVLGQLYTDTTSMHTYQCTAISGDTYTWTQRW